jgi:hypothetical protein
VAESQSTARIVSGSFEPLSDGAAEELAAAELLAALEDAAADVLAASSVPPEQAVRARPATRAAAAIRVEREESVMRGGYVAPGRESRCRDRSVIRFPVTSQPRPWRHRRPRSHTRGMARIAARLGTLVVALVALFAVTAVPAQADESALRERTHARIAAILSDAVNAGLYSTAQENYVTSALLPIYVDPKQLSGKVEDRTIEGFWEIVTTDTGVSEGQVRNRLSNGATLLRITGGTSELVQERLYRWLAKPVFAAFLDGRITASESDRLRDDIARSVDRLMRQPGGSDGKVAVSPRRM